MRLLIMALSLALTTGFTARAAEIKVLSAAAVQEALTELAPQFEKANGHKLTVTWSSSAMIRKQVAEGAKFDLIITSAPDIEKFIAGQYVTPGSSVSIGRTGVAVAIKDAGNKPDVSSPDKLKKAILEARAIAYSTGASGQYVLQMIDRMGILDAVKPKLKEAPPGTRVATLLVDGTADLGFQQMSEFTHERGITTLGYLPPEIQSWTIWTTGISSKAEQVEPAKALQAFLAGSTSVLKAYDIEPLPK